MSTMLDKPVLGPLQVELRPYQNAGVESVRNEFRKGRKSTLLHYATGLGKTITFGYIARKTIEKGGRVLILAHRDELIEQAENKLDALGVEAAIEKAEKRAWALWEPDCVIATVQTLQRKRLEAIPRDYFKLVIVDECHHATSKSYRNILNHFDAHHLGVTATPERSDEESLWEVYQSLAYSMTLGEAQLGPPHMPDGPWACRTPILPIPVDIDLRDIRKTAGDFNAEDLAARITPMIETLANAIRQEIGDRKTIIFTPDVASATAFATALSQWFNAAWVCGDDPHRENKIKGYVQGDTQILANCNLLCEGFDAPQTACIVLCRPTRSESLLMQQIGRGTRLKKPTASNEEANCMLLDFNYLTDNFDPVKPVQVFDSYTTDSEVMGLAQGIVDQQQRQNPGKAIDLLDCVQKAKAVHKERQVVRIQAHERKIHYTRVSYDPMAAYDTLGLAWRGSRSSDHVIKVASERQQEFLSKLGVTDAHAMSKTRAGTLISFLKDRMTKKLATLKQVSWMIASGLDPDEARVMTKAEASSYLDRLWGKKRTG